MKTTIKEIRQNVHDGQNRLRFIFYEGRFIIVASFSPSFEKFGKQVRFEVSPRRVKQLADDILNYLGKKAKWKKWEPTMEELERRLDERYHGDGLYMWFIDWARQPKNKKTAKRIYEWLKLADEMDAL